MARALALAAALAASLLAVSGTGGASAQTPKRGGTALLNRGGSPPPCLNFLNPRCTASLNLAARFFVGLAMPGAFEFRDDGTQRPRLVSRVEFTRKAPFILTYHIRREARWNDGVPVTAADFVFTYGALRKHFPPSSGGMDMTQVRSVRAMAPKTLRVVLSSRFAAWRSLFDIVLPRHALAGADLTSIWNDAVDDPGTRRPIGSGPFLISRYERDRRDPRIVLTRNPRYWGPHPAYLDRIVFWWSGLGPTTEEM